MTERREDLLHNMSAPPRSTLLLRPRQPAQDQGGGPAPSAWGLAWFARVDFDACLAARGTPVAGGTGRARLLGAVELARTLAGEAVAREDLEGFSDEVLEDELLDRAARQVPDPSLPAMLMASPAEGRRPAERDPGRLLAFLLHLTGRTCDLGGPPIIGAALREGAVLDLWAAP